MGILRGQTSFWDNYEVLDIVEHNVINFLSYGLLELGAFTNVEFGSSISGYTNLQRVYDPRYGYNKVWETFGPSLIWQSGLATVNNIQPINISGLYLNNTFIPKNHVGPNSYTIDYARGRVIFDAPQSGTVRMEYSFPDVAVYSQSSPQWQNLVNGEYEDLENDSPSGLASVIKNNRLWMPSVFVRTADRTNSALQLGGGERNEIGIYYYVFSDKAFAAKKLCDIINNQQFKELTLYNINNIIPPLNYDGSLASGAKTYPQLADRHSPYFWTYGFIEVSRGGLVGEYIDLYRGELLQKMVVDRYLSTYT